MFKKPRINVFIALILLCLLSGCVFPEITTSSSKDNVGVYSLSQSLIPYNIDATINLSTKRADDEGDRVAFVEDEVLITVGGNYCIEGSMDNGQLRVFAPDEPITLILNGATINCAELAPIYVEAASSVEIYVADSTVNTITFSDISEYEKELEATQESSTDKFAEFQRSAIMAQCKLTICGSGILNVNGYLNNGIQSTSTIEFKDVNLRLMATYNGIKSSSSITVDSGTYDIVTVGDSIQAGENFIIKSGTFAITTGEGSALTEKKVKAFPGLNSNPQSPPDDASFGGTDGSGRPPSDVDLPESSNSANFLVNPPTTDFDNPVDPADTPVSGAYASKASDNGTPSQKAIKAKKNVVLIDGSFDLDTADDAIHCDGSIRIHGGTINISCGDDAMHADDNMTITNGKINISDCYEGFEASIINIKGGDISITSVDDGINVSSKKIEPKMDITGGKLYINAGGDGIDSNKDITITGGEVYVDGPSSAFNSAIDVGIEDGGIFLVNGGDVTAIGASDMLIVPDGASAQQSISFVFDEVMGKGSVIIITDSNGNDVASFKLIKDADSIIYSSSKLKTAETYTITYGDKQGNITTDSVNATNYVPPTAPVR